MKFKKISGNKNNREVRLFAISTCPWCNKVKELLNELDIEYEYLDIDELSKDEKKKAIDKLEEFNPACSAPTLVIDGGEKTIIGFKEKEIKEALE